MRAIMAYGDALAGAGRPELAARCYWTLLRMQPEDSLGAREELKKAIDEACDAAATFAR
jgi:predicted TPR repeat methyltransferase